MFLKVLHPVNLVFDLFRQKLRTCTARLRNSQSDLSAVRKLEPQYHVEPHVHDQPQRTRDREQGMMLTNKFRNGKRSDRIRRTVIGGGVLNNERNASQISFDLPFGSKAWKRRLKPTMFACVSHAADHGRQRLAHLQSRRCQMCFYPGFPSRWYADIHLAPMLVLSNTLGAVRNIRA